MEIRKDSLATGQYYHIFSRSIAKYLVFNDKQDCSRIIELIDLYQFSDLRYRYSEFIEFTDQFKDHIIDNLKNSSPKLVEIIAYCIMPTHIHLLLKQTVDGGISKYMAKVLNSYTRYFNLKHHRKGPLWEGHFTNVLVISDEQLLHLTRYIHLNPTTAGLVVNPEDWMFSSYLEYIKPDLAGGLCNFDGLFDLNSTQYRKFTNDQKTYQRDLAIIKNILIDS